MVSVRGSSLDALGPLLTCGPFLGAALCSTDYAPDSKDPEMKGPKDTQLSQIKL